MCPADWGDKGGGRLELKAFVGTYINNRQKVFDWRLKRASGETGRGSFYGGNGSRCKKLLIPSAKCLNWNLQILKPCLWRVYATGCPVLCSKSFISCSYIMHQWYPFIINTNWHNKRLDFMQMSHDAIGVLFPTVVVTFALAKKSFLPAPRGSAALQSVAKYSLPN